MVKYTPIAYPISELIERRWSPIGFDSRPVETEKLLSLLEAARWAPSSRNEQPWRFIVGVRGQGDTFGLLADCLTGRNREWAPAAPVLVLTVAVTVFGSGKENLHATHDVGLATENLLLQCIACGLHCHPMGGFDGARARALLGIPKEAQPMAIVAVGYLGDGEHLSESLYGRDQRPRSRKPLIELALERWDKPHPLVVDEPR
ncbi:MAG: nitroreductase [Chloroflexi bacterium]|nr:nitroreductase [Chloroflexota bacterium]